LIISISEEKANFKQSQKRWLLGHAGGNKKNCTIYYQTCVKTHPKNNVSKILLFAGFG